MFPTDFLCLKCEAPMDAFGDHALLCSNDSWSGGIQLRHSLMQCSLGIILKRANFYHLVITPHSWLEHDDALDSKCGSSMKRHANTLLFSWRDDPHSFVDLVGLSLVYSCWRLAWFWRPSVQSMLRLTLPMASTAPHSVTLFKGRSALQLRRSSSECISDFSHVRIRPWEAHQWVNCRFSFHVMCGVAE